MNLLAAGGAAVAGAAAGPLLGHLAWRAPDGAAAIVRGPFGRRHAVGYAIAGAVALCPLGLFGWPRMLPAVVFALVAVPLCTIDLRLHRLPDILVLPGIALVLAACLVLSGHPPPVLLAAALAAGTFLVFYLLAVISPHGLGFGDVKTAALCAGALAAYGSDALGLWLVGLIPAAVLSYIVERRLHPERPRGAKAHVAFGPMLLGGAWLALAALALVVPK